jgi:hypothetical protein
LQVADAGFLFDADGDGVLVVAEETLEDAGEPLLLLGALGLAGGFALSLWGLLVCACDQGKDSSVPFCFVCSALVVWLFGIIE